MRDYHVAIISHKRPENVKKIMAIVGDCTFYVNAGEADVYLQAGANRVTECGTDICIARNTAIRFAMAQGVPCIQVSDDLKKIQKVRLEDGKHVVEPISFDEVCFMIIRELRAKNFFFGGVAVTNNRLNYTGEDVSYNKLIVNDLICVMPVGKLFDPEMALKEDYDFTIRSLIEAGGLVRLNNILCDFPHRDNVGGANTYRNSVSEQAATDKLYAKWGNLIKKHATREGQVSLNYKMIEQRRLGQQQMF